MSYHVQALPLAPRRTLAIGGILALHVLLVYLLATGLIQRVIMPTAPDIKAAVLPDEKHLPVPPPSPSTRPLVDVPVPPDPGIPEIIAPPGITALTPQPLTAPPAGAGVSEPHPVPLRILGKNLLPDSESYYPPDKARLGISGASYVRVCVDPRGMPQGDPALEQTSGDSGLDAAALNVARHGRYARALQGDQPVPTCFRFRIVFRPAPGR